MLTNANIVFWVVPHVHMSRNLLGEIQNIPFSPVDKLENQTLLKYFLFKEEKSFLDIENFKNIIQWNSFQFQKIL